MKPVSSEDEFDEAPLDPATERVQRKLKRLLFVSTATMGLGFLTVAIAVFYRLSTAGESGSTEAVAKSLTLDFNIAAEERVVDAAIGDDDVTLILDGPEGVRIVVIDPVYGDVKRERLLPRGD